MIQHLELGFFFVTVKQIFFSQVSRATYKFHFTIQIFNNSILESLMKPVHLCNIVLVDHLSLISNFVFFKVFLLIIAFF